MSVAAGGGDEGGERRNDACRRPMVDGVFQFVFVEVDVDEDEK